jgi:L-ascorbate metabolism protein UlaG (beta-lactamase superfamily)
MKDLKIYYIYHSCFLIETKNFIIIFDYFKTLEDKFKNEFSLREKISNTKKEILVFSSHSHYDHFNEEIFSWKNKYSVIKYILSKDIKLKIKKENYFIIGEGEKFKLDNVEIKAYGSTDIGLSFLIKVDTIKIFHAGDLNWWYWKDDTKEEEKIMRELYQSIIEKIKVNVNIDVAFFPVDPRLEEFCYLGAEYFAEYVKPKVIIPMHFDENYYVTEKLKEKIKKFQVEGIIIKDVNSLLII